LLDSSGEEFARMEGYLPAKEFLLKLESTISDPEALGNLRKREAEESENHEVRFKLARKLFSAYSFKQAEAKLERILRDDPENRAGVADSALYYLALCQASQMQSEASLATIDRLRRTYPESKLSVNAYLLSGELLIRIGRRDEARARLEGFLKSHPTHRLATQAKKLLAEI
jgi:TolA-binding protein